MKTIKFILLSVFVAMSTNTTAEVNLTPPIY